MGLFILLVLCLTGLTTLSHSSKIQHSNVEVRCVDMYKQPALNHPLLKDHKIQMRPSHLSRRKKIDNDEASTPTSVVAQIETKTCPPGMVPIQTLKQSANLSKSDIIGPRSGTFARQQFALLTIGYGKFYGGSASIVVPEPEIRYDQFSMGQVWVANFTSYDDENRLQAGYSLNPNLYGDDDTHFTVRWTTDGFKNTGCFDALCPGFVQVHPTLHIGARFSPTTAIGSNDQYLAVIEISHDNQFGHWWLIYNHTEAVGYWPKALLNNMEDGAKVVQFGGNTMASADGMFPAMGNGLWPSDDLSRSTYVKMIKYIDSDHFSADLRGRRVGVYLSNKKCVDLKYFGYKNELMGCYFTFGAPAGNCGSS